MDQCGKLNGKTLHITNGDSAAELIRQSGVRGKVLPWRDPMHHGPFPENASLKHTSTRRARYLASPASDFDLVQNDFVQRDAVLQTHVQYDETVLWFEHDLLDQLQMLQILNEMEQADRVSIICIDAFEGVTAFRGLGQLTPEQIASLFDKRQPVSKQQIDQASCIWAMFRQPNPRPLLEFSKGRAPLFPFLSTALRRHFQEYPWIIDGLTRTERQLLSLVRDGVTTPGQLFVENMTMETALFIGDWQTFSTIDHLASGDKPLLFSASDQYVQWASANAADKQYLKQTLVLTDIGLQVLDHTKNAINYVYRDEWLGGVHIRSPDNLWLWNDESQQLVKP